MRIGILGGTFDPPHIGHLILASEAQEQLDLDHVLWVLTPYPPHKRSQKISPLENRLTMVLLAIAGNPRFKLSRVDIDREPPHFATDTVTVLRQKSPKDMFYYLLGADSMFDLPTWHEPDKFISLCDGIGVMMRNDISGDMKKLRESLPGLQKKLHILEVPLIDISGSDIRRRVADGKQFRYFVTDKIYHYILNHQLYQS